MIPFIFADAFDELRIGEQFKWDCHRPWFRVCLRVIERDLHIHMPEVAAAKAFRDAQRFALGVAHQIESGLAVEAGCFHYKDVALPVPN